MPVLDIEAELRWDQESNEEAKAAVAWTMASTTEPPQVAQSTNDMTKVREAMRRDDPGVFDKIMRSFVQCAIAGDIEGMVELTSKVTILQTGLEKLKQNYANDTIPSLRQFPKVSDGGQVEYIDDGKGTTGWAFKKIFTSPGGEEARLQITVLKEHGEVRVSSFGFW